jgi:hypothetical protein
MQAWHVPAYVLPGERRMSVPQQVPLASLPSPTQQVHALLTVPHIFPPVHVELATEQVPVVPVQLLHVPDSHTNPAAQFPFTQGLLSFPPQ